MRDDTVSIHRQEASANGAQGIGARGLALVLIAVNVLNAFDLVLTWSALGAGNGEANPVMALLFSFGPLPAGMFKIACVGLVTAAIWRMRAHRQLVQLGVATFVLYAGILTVHMYGSLLYA